METNITYNFDAFGKVSEMAKQFTEALSKKNARQQIAAMIMASMMQNAKWGDKYSHIATIAVSAADALIAELNKKKEL